MIPRMSFNFFDEFSTCRSRVDQDFNRKILYKNITAVNKRVIKRATQESVLIVIFKNQLDKTSDKSSTTNERTRQHWENVTCPPVVAQPFSFNLPPEKKVKTNRTRHSGRIGRRSRFPTTADRDSTGRSRLTQPFLKIDALFSFLFCVPAISSLLFIWPHSDREDPVLAT